MSVLIESMKTAFNAYTKGPFLFVWSSIVYVILLVASLFASAGLMLVYFMAMSILGYGIELTSAPTLAVVGVTSLILAFLASGMTAGLSKAYRSAFAGERTSVTRFFSNSVEHAVDSFGVNLIRDILWIFLVGPAIAIYFLYVVGQPNMDMAVLVIGPYVVFATFFLHMLFTPASIAVGAFGADVISALKYGIKMLTKKHIFFAFSYIIFAIVWLLNFVPLVQIATILFVYPWIYTSIIVMMENALNMGRGDN